MADQRVAAVRAFNRFYTRQIGVVGAGYLDSPFSLTDVRVLYELAHRERASASDLVRELGLDPGYLSRLLRGFAKQGLVDRRRAEDDGRRSLLWLTERGWEIFDGLDIAARDQIGGLLAPLPEGEQERLIAAMATIEELLGERPPRPLTLRPHRIGDMGWVVQRHGELYAQEHGFDGQFEALVAEIVAKFVQQLDPTRERCWIAERAGQRLGCVFLVKVSDEVAKLRLFLVEPSARGLGIGTRLCDECIAFARAAGYRKVTLWTQSCLFAARRVYERAGFRVVASQPEPNFGRDDLISETWELTL